MATHWRRGENEKFFRRAEHYRSTGIRCGRLHSSPPSRVGTGRLVQRLRVIRQGGGLRENRLPGQGR